MRMCRFLTVRLLAAFSLSVDQPLFVTQLSNMAKAHINILFKQHLLRASAIGLVFAFNIFEFKVISHDIAKHSLKLDPVILIQFP